MPKSSGFFPWALFAVAYVALMVWGVINFPWVAVGLFVLLVVVVGVIDHEKTKRKGQ